jgi:hypothetical protein
MAASALVMDGNAQRGETSRAPSEKSAAIHAAATPPPIMALGKQGFRTKRSEPMGMRVGGGSAGTASQAAEWQQRRQDYGTMMAAAQSGDVASAQKAYASLTASRTPPANSPLAALGSALQSGDTSAIQTAAQNLQQARQGHHHHHHSSDNSSSSSSSTSSDSSASSSASSSGVNILA